MSERHKGKKMKANTYTVVLGDQFDFFKEIVAAWDGVEIVSGDGDTFVVNVQENVEGFFLDFCLENDFVVRIGPPKKVTPESVVPEKDIKFQMDYQGNFRIVVDGVPSAGSHYAGIATFVDGDRLLMAVSAYFAGAIKCERVYELTPIKSSSEEFAGVFFDNLEPGKTRV